MNEEPGRGKEKKEKCSRRLALPASDPVGPPARGPQGRRVRLSPGAETVVLAARDGLLPPR